MFFSIIILIFSFLLQGIISNYFTFTLNNMSCFLTIYPLITLLVLTPYFENSTKILFLVILFGLLIDIVYTNTFIFNACLFVVTYFLSKAFHFLFPYNLFTINISNLLSIFSYHIISFLFLSIVKYDGYGISVLFNVLSHSILMTIIYGSIIYMVIRFVFRKFELKEVK